MINEQIEIKHLKEVIPPILYNKLHENQIEYLDRVIDIDIERFKFEKGVGKKVITELLKFQDFARNNLEELINIYRSNTQIYSLPLKIEVIGTSDFLRLFSETITDYLSLLKNDRNKNILVYYYGLYDEDKLTLEDIATYYDNTRERIRQLKLDIIRDLQILLNGELNNKLRCKFDKELIKQFTQLKDSLIDKQLFTKSEFIDVLKNQFKSNTVQELLPFVELMIDLLGFCECNKVESLLTKARLIVTNEDEKKELLKAAEAVLRYMRKEIIALNEMQVIIKVKKTYKSLKNTNILLALNVLPEIEIYQTDKYALYQVKFEYLSNARDRAYRILLEKGDAMYIDDITSEINYRLATKGADKIYDRHSLALASDKRFAPVARTGYWTLKGWNKNTSRIDELVKTTLYKLNKPSTTDEIFHMIKELRPTIKEKSVKTIIRRDCIKVEGEKWILPEWRQKYSNLAFSKRIRRINTKEPEHRIEQRLKVIEYLTNKPNKKGFASQIIKDLKGFDRKYTRISFYKIFEQKEYFKKVNIGNKVEVSLIDDLDNTKLVIDEYSWNDVKRKLERDLSELFSGPECPGYNFTLTDSISLFHSVFEFEIQVNEFKGLKERILGNLNKYYFNPSDRTDKLNFLKQFLTCLDPFLKKILYIVNQADYQFINQHKKGLGDIFKKLDKLDPTEERYKDARTARRYKFGKQIQSSYYYRNNDTHGANDWTELEIIYTITNCFAVYIYACSEYYHELKNEINAA